MKRKCTTCIDPAKAKKDLQKMLYLGLRIADAAAAADIETICSGKIVSIKGIPKTGWYDTEDVAEHHSDTIKRAVEYLTLRKLLDFCISDKILVRIRHQKMWASWS